MKLKYNGIKALLVRNEITQSELADRMDVHRNTVASWLNGQRSANVEDVLLMLQLIGYKQEEILDMRLGDLMRVDED